MEIVLIWIAVPLAVLIGTLALTAVVLRWLRRRAILDHPVDRSSHQNPVPRGGGLALVPVLLIAWMGLALLDRAPGGTLPIVALTAGLALLSWWDDLRGLPAGLRFLGHCAAAAAGVAVLPAGMMVFQGLLPPLADRAAAALLWVWFVNLYNFMDGIDGITVGETVALGGGIALIAALTGGSGDGAGPLALCAVAGALGFLRWNWPPAKLFLGDIGSVALGFLLGWLLLRLAARGLWAPALILPLYYLADATLTLAKRLRRGERFWQAHRQHFYQRALGRNEGHGPVLRLIMGGNLLLVLLALLALVYPIAAVGLAVLVTAALLLLLEKRAQSVAP